MSGPHSIRSVHAFLHPKLKKIFFDVFLFIMQTIELKTKPNEMNHNIVGDIEFFICILRNSYQNFRSHLKPEKLICSNHPT